MNTYEKSNSISFWSRWGLTMSNYPTLEIIENHCNVAAYLEEHNHDSGKYLNGDLGYFDVLTLAQEGGYRQSREFMEFIYDFLVAEDITEGYEDFLYGEDWE